MYITDEIQSFKPGRQCCKHPNLHVILLSISNDLKC